MRGIPFVGDATQEEKKSFVLNGQGVVVLSKQHDRKMSTLLKTVSWLLSLMYGKLVARRKATKQKKNTRQKFALFCDEKFKVFA